MEKYGFSAEDILFIGDSLIDIETGRNAGVETVIFSYGFSDHATLDKENPDYLLSNCEELLTLIQKKGWTG